MQNSLWNVGFSFLAFILQEGRLEWLLSEPVYGTCHSYHVQIVVHFFFSSEMLVRYQISGFTYSHNGL